MESCTIVLKEILDSDNSVFSHLLQIGDTRILLNCGAPYSLFSDAYNIIDVDKLDTILLSHPSTDFLGALPYLLERGFKGKVYATFPIKILGKLIFRERCKHFEVFRKETKYTDAQIDLSFDIISGIKYLQPIDISQDISIMAYNSGHSLGGTVWKISKDTENIVFGTKFDHRKTNHLNGIDMASLPKNSLCVFDTGYAKQEVTNRKDRNRFLKEVVEQRLQMGKKILIIISYNEFLEVSLVLDEILRSCSSPNTKKNTRAACIGFSARKFSEMIKSMVEWAGDNVTKEFMESKENPFSFKCIDFFRNYTQMNTENRVFITFEDFGYTCKILQSLCEDKENLVLNFISNSINPSTVIARVPVFHQKKSEPKEVTKETPAIEAQDDLVHEKKMWYDVKTDVWDEDGDVFFPVLSKNKQFDDYNEFFDYPGPKENEVLEQEKDTSKVLEREEAYEEVEIEDSGFMVGCEIKSLVLDTVSDLKSSINVLESIAPEKLVLIPTERNLGLLYFYRVALDKNFSDVILLKKEGVFFDRKVMSKVVLDSKFREMDFKKIKNERYLGFRGFIEANELKYISKISTPITIGELNPNTLKRAFVEHNLRTEVAANVVLIENQVKLQVGHKKAVFEGEHNEFYYFARSIVYENLAYLD